MELLNILAQIIVVIAALIWVLLKFAWNTLFFIWELTRDYTPIFAKRVMRLLSYISLQLKKAYVWIISTGLPWFKATFLEVYHSFQTRIPLAPDLPQVDNLSPISGIPFSAPLTTVLPEEEIPESILATPLIQAQPTTISEPAFFQPLPHLKTNSLSALSSGIFSLVIFIGKVLLKLVGFTLYLSKFILSFVVYLIAIALALVLGLMSQLIGLRQHAPGVQDTFSFLSRLIPRISFTTSVSKMPDHSEALEEPKQLKTVMPSKHLSRISFIGMATTAVLLLGLLFPDIALKILPYKTEEIQSAVNASVLGGDFNDGNLYSAVKLPERNEYLPDGNWLSIPKIGVMTEITENTMENHEESLKKGVWRVPEFANPTEGKEYPTILVAHKYGYLKWTNDYRRKNSFYNLQKLEIGDTFEVIWDKRKFVYEIYAGEEGKEITDYDADVVLYTCKYLNSPVRIFRYARRVEY